MNLTIEQERAIHAGLAVVVDIANTACILVRKDVFEQGEELDYSPWTLAEMNMLALETAELVAGDGFDEPDNP